MGKSSGGTTTTVQNNDPWGPAQPYLTNLFKRANRTWSDHENDQITPSSQTSQFWRGARDLRPGNMSRNFFSEARGFGPGEMSKSYFDAASNFGPNQLQQNYWDSAGNYANTSDPSLLGAASDQATKTLRGDYLGPDSNPYLKATVDRALGQTRSAVNSNFGGDSFGTSAHQEWLGKQLSDTALPMYNQNYQAERDRQFNAMGAAQGITGAQHGIQMDKLGLLSDAGQQRMDTDTARLGFLGDAGRQEHGINTDRLNFLSDAGQQQNAFNLSRMGLLDQAGQQQMGIQNQNRNMDWDNLMRYQQAIVPGAGTGGTNTTQQPYHTNNLATYGSLGLGAVALYMY